MNEREARAVLVQSMTAELLLRYPRLFILTTGQYVPALLDEVAGVAAGLLELVGPVDGRLVYALTRASDPLDIDAGCEPPVAVEGEPARYSEPPTPQGVDGDNARVEGAPGPGASLPEPGPVLSSDVEELNRRVVLLGEILEQVIPPAPNMWHSFFMGHTRRGHVDRVHELTADELESVANGIEQLARAKHQRPQSVTQGAKP